MKKPLLLALAMLGASMPVQAAANVSQMIGVTRAVEIAEHNAGGQVIEVELDRTNNRATYEVELAKGQAIHELRIDARSGRILARSSSRIGNYWRQVFASDSLSSAGRSRPLSELLKKLEASTGGRVMEASFEMEGGKPRYEVEIATDAGIAELYLDAKTGHRLAFVMDD